MGDASLLVQCGYELLEREHEICAVVGSSVEVIRWANDRKLLCLDSEDVIRSGLPKKLDFDWFFSITNLRMLPNRIWRAASEGAVNFHDGPLPRHAGLNAPAWAILEGDTEYGITWHALSEGADEGDIYVQNNFEISSDETSLTLNLKCFDAAMASFGKLLEAIEQGSLVAKPQDLTKRTYHARDDRPKDGATIDFSQTAEEIGRLGRATAFGENYQNPLSLPKLSTAKGIYNVLSLGVSEHSPSAKSGTVLSIDKDAAQISAADGVVRVNALADEFGAPVAFADVLKIGDVLPKLDATKLELIDKFTLTLARNERFFQDRLQKFRDLEIYGVSTPTPGASARWQTRDFSLPQNLEGEKAIAAVMAGLSRLWICETARQASPQFERPYFESETSSSEMTGSANQSTSEIILNVGQAVRKRTRRSFSRRCKRCAYKQPGEMRRDPPSRLWAASGCC
jgi:methionyl-tRNA formyltransferase